NHTNSHSRLLGTIIKELYNLPVPLLGSSVIISPPKFLSTPVYDNLIAFVKSPFLFEPSGQIIPALLFSVIGTLYNLSSIIRYKYTSCHFASFTFAFVLIVGLLSLLT